MPEPISERTSVEPPPAGEIRITRLGSGTTVAWEGDRARGTVGPGDLGRVPPHDQRPPGDRPSLPVTPLQLRRAGDALGGLLRLRAASAPGPRRPRRA